MSEVTTVSGNRFPVYDITHKPKRYQSDNLRKAQADKESQDPVISEGSTVPQSVTIESAISYFEANATGEFRALYSSTAMWLRAVLSAKSRASHEEAPIESELTIEE